MAPCESKKKNTKHIEAANYLEAPRQCQKFCYRISRPLVPQRAVSRPEAMYRPIFPKQPPCGKKLLLTLLFSLDETQFFKFAQEPADPLLVIVKAPKVLFER